MSCFFFANWRQATTSRTSSTTRTAARSLPPFGSAAVVGVDFPGAWVRCFCGGLSLCLCLCPACRPLSFASFACVVCVPVCLCVRTRVCMSMFMSMCMCRSVCPCLCPSVCLCVCWPVGQSVCWPVGQSVCRPVGQSVCHCLCWPVGQLVCQCPCQSVCQCVGVCLLCFASLPFSCLFSFLSFFFSPLSAQTQSLLQRRDDCNIPLYLLQLSYINICNTGGKFDHPPAIVRLQAGTCEKGRMQGRACHSEAEGLKRPGAAWGMVSWVSRNPCPTVSRLQWRNGRSSLAYAPLSMCRWGGLRSDMGFLNSLQNGSKAMDTFAAAEDPKNHGGAALAAPPAPDPSRRLHRGGRGGISQPTSPERRSWVSDTHARSERKRVPGKVPPSAALYIGGIILLIIDVYRMVLLMMVS